MSPRTCTIEGCEGAFYGRGYCERHWRRWHRRGDPGVAAEHPNRLPGATIAEKLHLNSVRDGDCLRWTGTHTPTGYGTMRVARRAGGVHRHAYEVAFGPIPPGLDVDHVAARGCRWRDCIEPSHLEAVTHAENLRRARVAKRGDSDA